MKNGVVLQKKLEEDCVFHVSIVYSNSKRTTTDLLDRKRVA